MNLAALLRELYPPQVPRGLHVALLTAQLHTAACPLPQMQCPTPEQLLLGYEVIGVTDVYGMPELLYAERQGLLPLPAWARGEGGIVFA